MLRLQCRIIVEHNVEGGKKIVSFDYVNAIEVKTSVTGFTDTATVKVPRKMYWKGHSIMEYLQRNDAIGADSERLIFWGFKKNLQFQKKQRIFARLFMFFAIHCILLKINKIQQ